LPRSGRRSGLPSELGVTPLVPPGPGTGLKVRSAENVAGCRPDSPYAARRRSDYTTSASPPVQKGSSCTTHEALTLG
jgi:hypothetical protein